MKQNYLPSKKFIAGVMVITIFIGVIWGIYGIVKFFKNRANRKAETSANLTVSDIIQKDGNTNGIPDWEEYLWGLDPYKNGDSNKEFINNKKKLLSQNEISLTDGSVLTENEIMSREFFAAIVALQESNNLNDESMKSISDVIGEKIQAPELEDIYTREMLSIKTTSDTSIENYYDNFKKLATKYEDKNIGDELSFIIQGIKNNDPQALYVAQMVASSYREFGKDLVKTPVPGSMADIHLSLVNNYEKVAQSIEGLAQILKDPIISMRALVNYKKYVDALVSDIEKLSNPL